MPPILSQYFLDPRAARFLLPALAICLLLTFLYTGGGRDLVSDGSAQWASWATATTARQQSLDQILNSTLGFEKVFAINLPSRTDHRDALTLASRLTGFDLEFIDGVRGSDFDHKAMPPSHKDDLSAGVIGCWAAHVKTLQQVVQRNMSTALIIEADSDWDVRIKSQLQDLATSTNALLQAEREGTSGNIPFSSLSSSIPTAVTSPYGDGWDMIWMGHCEMRAREEGPRIIHTDDPTTVAMQHLWTWEGIKAGALAKYPEHTRAVFPTNGGVCTYGYAVSHQGAQKLLYHLSLNDFNDPIDVGMRKFCSGKMAGDTQGPRKCIGVLPALILTHWPAGDPASSSDIADVHGDFRRKGQTPLIRKSIMLNLRNMVDGRDIEDQYPEDG